MVRTGALVTLTSALSVASAQQPNSAEWGSLLEEFEPQVKAAFPTNDPHRRDIRVYCTVDVTGDGLAEAVIMLGTGGVSTEAMALLRIENNAPAIARWRRRDGNIDRVQVLKGDSATYRKDFELNPPDRAISRVHCTMADTPNEPETAACTANSYVWSDQSKLFEYDAVLSERVAGEYFRRRRERETSKYFPSPGQPRVLTECGQSGAAIGEN